MVLVGSGAAIRWLFALFSVVDLGSWSFSYSLFLSFQLLCKTSAILWLYLSIYFNT